MNSPIQALLVLTIGATITIGGLTAKTDDILASAHQAANVANVHQLSTALELYYLDHNAYPKAEDGSALVNILTSEHYIKSQPLDSSVFAYQLTNNGNDYNLSVK